MTRRSFMESGDPADLRAGDKVRIRYLGLESPRLTELKVDYGGDLMAGGFTVLAPGGRVPIVAILEHEPRPDPLIAKTVAVRLPTIPRFGYTLTTVDKIIVVHSDGLIGMTGRTGLSSLGARLTRDQLRDLAAHLLAAAEGMGP